MGNLSDRFGRRPVLLSALFALGIDYVVMGFAPTLAWLFARPLRRGNRRRVVFPGVRLHRRHQSAGKARAELRVRRRCLRPRLRARTDDRRPARLVGAAHAVLRRRGTGAAERDVRAVRVAGVAAARATACVRMVARESVRHADATAQAAGRRRPRRRVLPVAARASGSAEHLGLLHDAALRLVRSSGRSVARRGGHRHGDQPGRADGRAGPEARR